jgi:DNA-binding SARP family transcriptional activator
MEERSATTNVTRMTGSVLNTLGTCTLLVGEKSVGPPSTQKARAIFAFLALHRRTDVSRERLLELFWPDADPDRGRDNLRTALWSIRRCLKSAGVDPDEFISANKSIVRWRADTSVDAEEFELLAAGSSADIGRAMSVYKGDFLEGDYEDWTVAERERLAASFEAVLGKSLEILPDAHVAQQLLARNPYVEEAYATLIEAELRAGRRMAAVAHLERCRSAFREMGTSPSEAFEKKFGTVGLAVNAPPAQFQMPFVGREGELAAIERAIDATGRSRGWLALVHGEAGIGKSTLFATAAQLASARSVRVLDIRCGEGESRMFGPWPAVIEAVTGSDFAALTEAGGASVSEGCADAMAASLTKPSLILVDDAHALRGEALAVLKAVVVALSGRHVCIIGARPEGVLALRALFEDVGFEELTLGPLDRNDLESTFGLLTGEPKSPFFNALFERTGGHPLFLSAMLSMIASSGLVKREGYRWRFASDAATSLGMPAPLRRFIETRMHGCGEDACAVACALALEPEATTDNVIEALAMPDERALDALDVLLSHGLIVEPTSGPQFAFSHDVIREVAATLLNAGRRERLHRAFADQLQRVQARDRSLRLARHLLAAGQPLEAGAAYHDAVLEAIEWSAFGDVVSRAVEGVAAVERLDRTPARDAMLALLKRAESGGLAFGGDPTRAIAPADEAIVYARASGDRHVLTRTLLARAFAAGEAGEIPIQLGDASEAVEIAREFGEDVLLAKALVQRSTASVLLDVAEDAPAALSEAADIAVRHDEWGLAGTALGELVKAHIVVGRFAAALEVSNRELDAARRSDPSVLATAHHYRASLWYVVDRFEEALRELAVAASIMASSAGTPERWGRGGITAPTMLYAVNYQRGLVEARCRRWGAAIECVDAIREGAPRVIASRRYECAYRLLAIDALLGRGGPGDLVAAEELAAPLPADVDSRGIVGWSDSPALARARIAVYRNKEDTADLLRHALASLRRAVVPGPLDVDRWFSVLAETAERAKCHDVANEAKQLTERYLRARRAAAGSLWGGV